MTSFALLSALLFLTGKAFTKPIKYDERQEGDLNVRADVENVVFVVVPPQDLIAAGMGLFAASAINLIRKNYEGIRPERAPQRTSSKLGFVLGEKSPYKIGLEQSRVQAKNTSQFGDPYRYNFYESKNSTKVTQDIQASNSTRSPNSSIAEKIIEIQEESSTENPTIKEDLKSGEAEKEAAKKENGEKVYSKPEKLYGAKAEIVKKTEDPPRVIGENAKGGLNPVSISRHEGCGPDAYRDSAGMCIIKKIENGSK